MTKEADNLLKICDKYQSDRYLKIIKLRFFALFEHQYCEPWRIFVIACRMEWEDLAQSAIRRFSNWTLPYGTSVLPQNLPQRAIDYLGFKHTMSFVRACDGCGSSPVVDWVKAASQFSFAVPAESPSRKNKRKHQSSVTEKMW
jgi:hypothetical protein